MSFNQVRLVGLTAGERFEVLQRAVRGGELSAQAAVEIAKRPDVALDNDSLARLANTTFSGVDYGTRTEHRPGQGSRFSAGQSAVFGTRGMTVPGARSAQVAQVVALAKDRISSNNPYVAAGAAVAWAVLADSKERPLIFEKAGNIPSKRMPILEHILIARAWTAPTTEHRDAELAEAQSWLKSDIKYIIGSGLLALASLAESQTELAQARDASRKWLESKYIDMSGIALVPQAGLATHSDRDALMQLATDRMVEGSAYYSNNALIARALLDSSAEGSSKIYEEAIKLLDSRLGIDVEAGVLAAAIASRAAGKTEDYLNRTGAILTSDWFPSTKIATLIGMSAAVAPDTERARRAVIAGVDVD